MLGCHAQGQVRSRSTDWAKLPFYRVSDGDVSGPLDQVVVEDEPVMLEVMERALAFIDCTACYLKTAEEAWSLIQERGVRVLLTDLHFAGMKGGELIARVLESVPTAAIFAMTGYHAAAAEVKDHLKHIFYKPFFPSQVAAHVHLSLLGQRYHGK
ncbi:MAG: response regulator [Planctomycetota bacterium]